LAKEKEFLVIGLGRFGGGLAETLVELGHEVLGVDSEPKLVQSYSGRLTHVVEADSTDIEALRQLGAGDFGTAVVAIGTEIEASILTTAALTDLEIPGRSSSVWERTGSSSPSTIWACGSGTAWPAR
jgi:trk system potassium uptake protein TrkA